MNVTPAEGKNALDGLYAILRTHVVQLRAYGIVTQLDENKMMRRIDLAERERWEKTESNI